MRESNWANYQKVMAMPPHPDRVRRNYPDDERDAPEKPCICGSQMHEPHAPECYRLKRETEPDEPGYGMEM